MLRVFKSYHLDTSHDPSVSGSIGDYRVLFSSYPGLLWSKDDLYVVSGGPRGTHRSLVVLETTNTICNASLYAYVSPASLATWQREIIANMLAVDAPSWAQAFSCYNSATCKLVGEHTHRIATARLCALLCADCSSLLLVLYLPVAQTTIR
jgi:hypothetical protein